MRPMTKTRTRLALVMLALLLLVPARVWTQVGTAVQNGFRPCAGVNCDNALVLNGSDFKYATVSMTNAQVLALLTTSKSIVAAPGAGKIVEVLGGLIVFDYVGAYTETGANDNW